MGVASSSDAGTRHDMRQFKNENPEVWKSGTFRAVAPETLQVTCRFRRGERDRAGCLGATPGTDELLLL